MIALKYKLAGRDLPLYFDPLELKFLNISGEDVTKDFEDMNNPGSYIVELYGFMISRPLIWWRFYAFYNTELPIPIRSKIFELDFVETQDSKHLASPSINFLPIFKTNPTMEISGKKCKVSAMYPWYGASENGNVYKLETGMMVNVALGGDKTKYMYNFTKIYSKIVIPSIRTIGVHRIVALAWCENDDWKNKPFVDHIDEDKSNNKPSNLRWVSASENVRKSLSYRTEDLIAVTRNIDTGEVKEYGTIKLAFSGIGRSYPTLSNTPLKQGRIWIGSKGRFEIYRKVDFIKWEYHDCLPEEKTGKRKRSEIDFKSIDMINVTTRETKSFPSYAQCAKFLNQDIGRVKRRLKYFGVDKIMPIGQWLLKFDFQDWPKLDDVDLKGVYNEAREIEVLVLATGEKLKFKSKKAFAKAYGTCNNRINYSINTGKPIAIGDKFYRICQL